MCLFAVVMLGQVVKNDKAGTNVEIQNITNLNTIDFTPNVSVGTNIFSNETSTPFEIVSRVLELLEQAALEKANFFL